MNDWRLVPFQGYLTIEEVFGSGLSVEASTSDPHIGDAYLMIQVVALRPLQTP